MADDWDSLILEEGRRLRGLTTAGGHPGYSAPPVRSNTCRRARIPRPRRSAVIRARAGGGIRKSSPAEMLRRGPIFFELCRPARRIRSGPFRPEPGKGNAIDESHSPLPLRQRMVIGMRGGIRRIDSSYSCFKMLIATWAPRPATNRQGRTRLGVLGLDCETCTRDTSGRKGKTIDANRDRPRTIRRCEVERAPERVLFQRVSTGRRHKVSWARLARRRIFASARIVGSWRCLRRRFCFVNPGWRAFFGSSSRQRPLTIAEIEAGGGRGFGAAGGRRSPIGIRGSPEFGRLTSDTVSPRVENSFLRGQHFRR